MPSNKRIDIPCPKCGKKAVDVFKWITSYYDPHFYHKPCGYDGKLSWAVCQPATTPTRNTSTTGKIRKPRKAATK